jgi:hypothetical protein
MMQANWSAEQTEEDGDARGGSAWRRRLFARRLRAPWPAGPDLGPAGCPAVALRGSDS